MVDTIELELVPVETSLELALSDEPDLDIYYGDTDGALIELEVAGPQGAKGDQGLPGAGFPTGGADRQVLRKQSGADYDAAWVDESFSQQFTNQASLSVEHNLGRKPAVTVIDSTGDEIEGKVTHLNNNQLEVVFSASFTGAIICS